MKIAFELFSQISEVPNVAVPNVSWPALHLANEFLGDLPAGQISA